MHLIIDIKEFNKRIKNSKTFPFEEGDTFVVEGEAVSDLFFKKKEYQPLKRYKFKNNELVMVKDFIKSNKRATKKDYERVGQLSTDEIIKFNAGYASHEIEEDSVPYAEYESFKKEFKKRFKFFYDIESYSIFEPTKEIYYAVPKIMCDQNNSVEDHIKEFEILFPYLKYVDISDDIGMSVMIYIFEETFSKNGIYTAYLKKDGKCILTKTTFGRQKTIKDFENYKEMIRYIYDNHPYKRMD